MLSWFRPDPKRRLKKQYEAKLREAHEAMTKLGDRGRHAELMAEADELAKKLDLKGV